MHELSRAQGLLRGRKDPRKNNFPDWQAATARREEEEFSRKGAKSAEKGMGIDLRHVRT